MQKENSIDDLINRYMGEIEILNAELLPPPYSPDPQRETRHLAHLELSVPTRMIKEYKRIMGLTKKLPNAKRFLIETGLLRRLEGKGLAEYGQTEEGEVSAIEVSEVLEYLLGKVYAEYGDSDNNSTTIEVKEIPEED